MAEGISFRDALGEELPVALKAATGVEGDQIFVLTDGHGGGDRDACSQEHADGHDCEGA